jgi:rhamnogalacturonyl hydrolase YesR
MRRRDLLLSSFATILAPAARAQTPVVQDRRTEIEAALRAAGAHAANVLITPEGKGRADYDLLTGEWREYEPHWHTGQQILGLLQAWRITGEPTFLAAAQRGGDWWVSTEFQPPHPLAGLVNAYHGDHVGPLINFTTISDGSAGLFALSRATRMRRYADCATRSGAWLYANTRVPGADQLFYNMIDPATGRVITDYSPHHRDVTMPSVTQTARPNIEGSLFLDMYRHTRNRVWRDRFVAQAQGALRWQRANGLWMDFEPNDSATGQVHPRFNIWNAEALLEAHAQTRDTQFLEGALRTGRFMARVQDRRGAIYYDLNEDGSWTLASITGSAVAFAAMLWMRLRAHGVGDEFTPNIERALDWVLANRFNEDHPDVNLRGAVLETRVRVVEGRTRALIRDIATAFGLRFLAMAHDEMSGRNINEAQL